MLINRFLKGLMAAILILSIYACHKDKLDGSIVSDAELAAQLLAASQDSVVIDNQTLVLETELYRDFFPGMPSESRSNLQALTWVVNADSSIITNRFTLSKLYIINQDEIWITKPEVRNDNNAFEYKLHAVSINGPQWDTGIKVDVVVEVIDLNSNQPKKLIAKDQVIERIE